jgi:FAD:protein FMN transferase
MGCRFEITAIADTENHAQEAVFKGIVEIKRIENLISEWDSTTQTSEINRNAGLKPVMVDKELYDLIFRSKKVSELTGGAFDISFASMDKIWIFDGKEHNLPDSLIVAKAKQRINWENIILNLKDTSVYLSQSGMKIGFGAIGKGYAANRAKKIMEQHDGVKGGVVNASGDLIAWGVSNNPEGWRIQIADPKNKEEFLGWLNLNDMSIVTSGDYENYFTSEGVRYSHIINPKTGYPVTETKSVTILCPDAEIADALATSVSVLGVEKGLDLINKLNNVECMIVDKDDKIYYSANLKLNYYK